MSDIVFALVALVALAVALVAPVLLGMQTTKARPNWPGWLVAAVAALPTALPPLGFAAWIAATSDITPCENPPCESFASLWFDVMLALGGLAFLLGFALGWIGRMIAHHRAASN